MSIFTQWVEVTQEKLLDLWQGFLGFIPELIGAVIIFGIGWFIAAGVGRLITEILKRVRFNQIFEKGAWKEALEKADVKVDASGFIGAIVKWVLVIVFLLAAVEILGFQQFAGFLNDVLGYLPNVVVAALIFVVTVIVVDIVDKVLRTTVESMKVGYGHMVSIIVRWSIWVFAVLTILHQLGIAQPFMEDLFRGIVAMLVLALGISFGFGGKDVAAEILRDIQKKLKG